MVCGAGLDVADHVGEANVRFEADEDVGVVGHAMDGEEFLILACNDAGDVFL